MPLSIYSKLFDAGIRHAGQAEEEPEMAESASAPCAKACSLFVQQFEADGFGLDAQDAELVRAAIERGEHRDLERAYWYGWRFVIEGGGRQQ